MENSILSKYKQQIKEGRMDPMDDPWTYRDFLRASIDDQAVKIDGMALSETDFMYSDGNKARAKKQVKAMEEVEQAIMVLRKAVEKALKVR